MRVTSPEKGTVIIMEGARASPERGRAIVVVGVDQRRRAAHFL